MTYHFRILPRAVLLSAFFFTVFFAVSFAMSFSSLAQGEEKSVSYNRDVRPILSNNCFFCHGFDEDQREADLRLDTLEGALETEAIVPGEPDESLLVERVFSDDPDEVMPPSDSAYSLTADQKETLRRWIEQGGEYQEHWAYRKLVRPTVPGADETEGADVNADADSSRSAIDTFLQRTWKENGVEPVGKASPRELLRRLSYDLRGLAPTFDEVRAFENDPTEENYQEFVRQWTTSTEYAEHQGLLWLDLVRWADSSGMVSDEPIASGQYRKYVIEAFRENMPFDQFTREQLAGDLLPDRNPRTLVASGYNRLVKTNCEAGVIEEEALHALKGEHVRAIGTVWLGATTGCIECHDHKYDPLTARDYYSLAAFFDDLIEVGVYDPGDRRPPIAFLYDDEKLQKQDERLAREVTRLRKTIYGQSIYGAEGYSSDASGDDVAALKNWEDKTRAALKKVPARDDFVWMPKQLPPARISSGDFTQSDKGRIVTAPHDKLVSHSASEVMTGFMYKVLDGKSYPFTRVTLDKENPPQAIAVQIIHGDYQRQGWLAEYFTTYFWGDPSHAEKLKKTLLAPERLVHLGELPAAGTEIRLPIPRAKIKSSPHDPIGMSWIQIDGTVTWGDSGYELTGANAFAARLAESTCRYWWELPQNRDDRDLRMKLVVDSLKIEPKKRRQIHRDAIRFAWCEQTHRELVNELRDAYRELFRVRQSATDSALVSKVGPLKETRLRKRGNFMDESGARLEPNLPEFLVESRVGKPDQRLNRIDLANWLVSRDNPLTPRVFVNRLWHQFYGRGLSETLEDAGNQGDWPSHPELLDWLAAEFVDSDWDVRHIIRLMVSSDAYRLSSVPAAKVAKKDPANRLHTRQGRHRHSAEEIRDSALRSAGMLQLTEQVPTRSFYPYQPDSYWVKSNKVMFGSRYQIWETNKGASQYQRSLYTFWKRQNPHPSLLAFDAPTRQECTAQRATTNTPGQALALLNDPTFVEAARVLASKLLGSDELTSNEQRITSLFRRTLQRSPSKAEMASIRNMLAKFEEKFANDPQAADALLGVGQFDSNSEIDSIKHAAWTATCRVVLNLHEFITRS